MYLIKQRQTHPDYGPIIEIVRDELGSYDDPFLVEKQAKKEWKKGTRFLIDNQIFNIHQLEIWIREEYQSLPKCQNCAKILKDQVFSHDLAGNGLFCSQICSDYNYHQRADHLNDYEECDI
jgi:hypothetical protein